MRIPIDFDNQRTRRAHEVRDVRADDFLPAKFQTIDLAAGEVPPQPFFWFRWVLPHLVRAFMKPFNVFVGQPPPQAPPLKGRGFWSPAFV
jgi:hypothetical protein